MKWTRVFKIISILVVFAVLLMCTIDYYKTIIKMEKPVFAIVHNGVEDGGSGNYIGLGYNIELSGQLTVEYGYVVNTSEFYLLGIKVDEANVK